MRKQMRECRLHQARHRRLYMLFLSGLHENAGPEIRVAATAIDLLIEHQVKMDIQR